jgi:nicotinate-nucleotide--dimethylbenzimidazole phosphoribosyltransferase
MSSIAPVSAQRGRFAHAVHLAVLIGCGVAVVSCNSAIETVRSLRGINKNDPDPATAPFSGNMAAAEAEPYPNLASVPPPPTRGTSAAERQKLTENLIAERTAAQAFASASAAAQPAATKQTAPSTISQPTPASAEAAATPPQPPAATEAAPIAGTQPPPAPSPVTATPEPPPATLQSAAVGEAQGRYNKNASEPTEALPRDSELRMPQVRSRPEPDIPRPAPASPRLAPLPSPTPAALSPAAIASAAPQPAPSVPELAPIAPPPAPSLATSVPPRAPVATTVAMLDALEPGQIAQVAARYKEELGSPPPPQAVRVIAFTAPPAPGADPLGGYHDALERAQAVAKALAEAGIPEKIIQTEAKPAAGPIAAARIEIQFLP